MKKLYTLALAGLLFNLPISEAKDSGFQKLIKKDGSQKEKSRLKTSATIEKSLPQFEHMYYWDETKSQYKYSHSVKNYYDSKGQVIVNVDFYQGADTTSKTSYTYNATGETIQTLITNYDLSHTWVNYSKSESTYDSHGNGTGYIYYKWNTTNNTWEINSGSRSTNTYDGYGRPTVKVYEGYNNASQIWENGSKETYVYQGASEAYIEYTEFKWNGSQWEEIIHVTDIVWHNFAEYEMSSYTATTPDGKERSTMTYSPNFARLTEEFVNNTWVNKIRYTSSIDASGNQTAIKEEYINNAWIITEKYLYFVDSKGNNVGHEEYKLKSESLVLTYYTTYTHTYDSEGNILVTELEGGNTDEAKYKSKSEFSDYITFSITDNQVAKSNVTTVSAYPNPTIENVTIENLGIESKLIRLYNSQNKEVTSFTTSEEKAQISLSNLPEGLYILKAESASGKLYVAKVVKQ